MNNILEYKGYLGSVEFSADDNILFGKVLGINGLISFEGDSVQNLKKDFEEAVDDYIEICNDNGVEPEKPYRGNFNVRISPELHKILEDYSSLRTQSLNRTIEEALYFLFKSVNA